MRSLLLCLTAAVSGAGLALYERPRPSEAGTAIRMDLDGLVERAGLALEAHVASATSLEINGEVFTDFHLIVDRTWWGEDLPVRTVRLPGGALPSGKVTIVPGMPSLVPGDDVVILLTEPGLHDLRVVVGLNQGRWRIVGDGMGGKLAVRGSEGASLVGAGGGLPLPADRLDVMDYAGLIARMEAAAGARRAREQAEGK